MNGKIIVFAVFCLLLVVFNISPLESVCAAQQDGGVQVMDLNNIGGLTRGQLQAKNVLVEFFYALREGNTTLLEELIDGSLLDKRKRLLGNPLYSEFLKRRYSDASFEICRYENIGSNRIRIDARIVLSQEESIPISFLLVSKPHNVQRRFSVYDEIQGN